MTQYAVVEAATGRIVSGWGKPDPEDYDGQPDWQPFPHDGLIYRPWQGPLLLGAQPAPTAELLWQDGPAWVERAPLEDVIARALDDIDVEADKARMSVLVKTTKSEEYMQAEAQAREWSAAAFAGDAPPDVASWAAAKHRDGMTPRQAADSIIAQADQYRGLLSGIRALRLMHMENARHALDVDGVKAVKSEFSADLIRLMKGPA